MALPHTVVELINRAGITGNERAEYERRVQSILHKVYEKGFKVGHASGYSAGMEECLNLMETEEENENLQQTVP